ncbi:MAG: helix-turn-helix domain-containing protein [Candidatus Thorarchaeota archaeon]
MGNQLSIDIRRQKVLALLVQGYTPTQIVKELGVSRQTVWRDRVWLKEKKKTELDLVRGYSWDKLNKLLEEGGLTKFQEAKLRLELLRIIEPSKVGVDGKIDIIFKTDESLEAESLEQSEDAEN